MRSNPRQLPRLLRQCPRLQQQPLHRHAQGPNLQRLPRAAPKCLSPFNQPIAPTPSHFLLDSLAQGSSGLAGLGQNRIAVPIQLEVEFKLRAKFAICLSSAMTSDTVIFFSGGPCNFLPNVDANKSLVYTLAYCQHMRDRSSTSSEWWPSRPMRMISTLAPYAVSETSIYNAVTDAFVAAMTKNVKRVASIAPFKLCHSARGIGSAKSAAAVPLIDLVLQCSENTRWRFWAMNLMVEAKPMEE